MTGSDSHNTYTMHYKHYHVRYKGLNIGYINYSYIRFSDLELSFWFELGYLKAVKVRLWVSKHDHPWVRVLVDISLVP